MLEFQKDKKLAEIMRQLQEKYACHTIILYGSYARGEANEQSDYDIAAIREKGEMQRDCRLLGGVYLDSFIYSEKEVKEPDSSFIHMKDGIVICQKHNIGDEFLSKIKKIYQQGPKKIPDWEKQVIVTWSQKMLARAKVGDIEGNYRRHWLLFDLLQAYFHLRDQWYLGPKESFLWLNKSDQTTFSFFEKALEPTASLENLEKLIHRVTAIPD